MRNLMCLNLLFAVVLLAGADTASAGALIDVAFTGASVTSKTGFAAVGETTNDFWNTCGTNSGTLPNLKFVDGTASGAGLTVANANYAGANGASDPMYDAYLYSGSENVNITVTVSNLFAGGYDFYLYGHGNEDSYNSVFQISVGSQRYGSEATTNGSGWLSSVWQEGVQYVEFTNIIVSAGQTITVLVQPAPSALSAISGLQIVPVRPPSSIPFIVTQPANQAVMHGGTATLSVVAGGATPMAYQWLFDSTNISTATNSSYIVTNAQPATAGSYSVIVANAYGSVTSAVAELTVGSPLAGLIDVAFTGPSVTGKTGFADIGVTTNDLWNTGPLPNLDFVDGTASGAGLTVANEQGLYTNGSPDPMYGSYLFNYGGQMILTVTNLVAGAYDFYLYGHGNEDNQNSVFELTAGSVNYGSEATTNGSGWLSSVWQEGVQYVEFTNVIISNATTITITVEPGAGSYSVLSGLQMAPVGTTTSVSPFIVNQPADQAVIPGLTATFSVVAGGAAPLTYQWVFDNSNIAAGTNSSYSVTNAQPTNVGSYSVILSDASGSVTTRVAALSLVAHAATLIDVAFTGLSVSGKTGFAAAGLTTNDFWNAYVLQSGSIPQPEIHGWREFGRSFDRRQ